jgi:outer membrane phospholipase A
MRNARSVVVCFAAAVQLGTLGWLSAASASPPAQQTAAWTTPPVRTLEETFFALRLAPLPATQQADPLLPEGSERFEKNQPIDVKFQLGPAFDLIPNRSPIRLEFTYAQTSWWPIGLPSAPFRETNYNPGFRLSWRLSEFCNHYRVTPHRTCIRYARPKFTSAVLEEVAFGGDHISDGEGLRKVDETRSLNRAYAEVRLAFTWQGRTPRPTPRRYGDIHARLKVWMFIGNELQNWDIARYVGYGELELAYGYRFHFPHWHPAWFLSGTGRIGMPARHTGDDEQTNVSEFNWVKPPGRTGSFKLTLHLDVFDIYRRPEEYVVAPRDDYQSLVPNIYMQWFYGYAESLKTYSDARSVFYAGLALQF